jgi:hypothetical protein
MSNDLFHEFDQLGEVQVRQNLAMKRWGNTPRDALARQWLQLQESSRTAEVNAATLDEARSANELARAANSLAASANATADAAAASARLSAAAARTNNIIAIIALIAAVIAIAISIIGIFMK